MKYHVVGTRRFIGFMVASLALVGCQGVTPDPTAAEETQPSRAASVKLQGAQTLQAAFPAAQLYGKPGGSQRLYGATLATGGSADEAAAQFRQRFAAALGVEEGELTAQSYQSAQGSPAVGLMVDPETRQPKFWLYRYQHSKAGVPVYAAGLRALVRNDASNAVVWAVSTVRALGNFTPTAAAQVRMPDADKSLRAIPQATGSTGAALPAPTAIATMTDPERIVFAGTEDAEVPPRMAIRYMAETLPYGKWQFIADATTGEILHVDNLISYVNVTGNVAGNRTQGDVASECAGTVQRALPQGEVLAVDPFGALPNVQAYADASGNYVLSTTMSTAIFDVSMIGNRFFHVHDARDSTGGLDDLLFTFVSLPSPVPVNFIHNSGGPTEPTLALYQVNGLLNANEVRDFALRYVPNFPEVATERYFPVNVNLDGTINPNCPGNAFYDPWTNSINFCQAGTDWLGNQYTNTAFASVVHHEYTHRLIQAATPYQQNEYGEGMGDTIAALFSGDSRLGLGFFLNQCATPLRNALNACQYSAGCSTCGSDIHTCGQLLSGAIWDIRTALSVTHPSTFADIINNLTVNSILLHAGASISAALAIDFLTLDDNDGNLNNGTPHRTEICTGFGNHGMPCPPLPPNPCGAFCPSSTTFTITGHDWHSPNLGTGASCYETTSDVVGGNCGGFVNPRTLKVNGVTYPCNYSNWALIPAPVNGGYCIQVSPGNQPYAYFAVWRP